MRQNFRKEKTVEAVTLVPRVRVQLRAAEKIWDVPQFRKETCEQIGVIEVPETASQDRRLQHTVEQAFVDRVEAVKIALQERISAGMRDQISREYLQCYFTLWVW